MDHQLEGMGVFVAESKMGVKLFLGSFAWVSILKAVEKRFVKFSLLG